MCADLVTTVICYMYIVVGCGGLGGVGSAQCVC